MTCDRKTTRTRHVLAVKDLAIETAYYLDKLGFERDFTAPGWEFLSFGEFKVMLGECPETWTPATPAATRGLHTLSSKILTSSTLILSNAAPTYSRRSKINRGKYVNSAS